jgi:hypothetical protein
MLCALVALPADLEAVRAAVRAKVEGRDDAWSDRNFDKKFDSFVRCGLVRPLQDNEECGSGRDGVRGDHPGEAAWYFQTDSDSRDKVKGASVKKRPLPKPVAEVVTRARTTR